MIGESKMFVVDTAEGQSYLVNTEDESVDPSNLNIRENDNGEPLQNVETTTRRRNRVIGGFDVDSISAGSEVRRLLDNKNEKHTFPWMVRIVGMCGKYPGRLCGGSLISPRLVASAFHCAQSSRQPDQTKACDLSNEARLAVLGSHEVRGETAGAVQKADHYTIPIVEAKVPPVAGYNWRNRDSHDFVLMVLKHPAEWSDKVQPICLPAPNQEFAGQPALAAGWGRHQPKHQATTATGQSRMLKYVELRVSHNQLQHYKMFGTQIPRDGPMKDVCSGDSGTVYGKGYDCRKDVTNTYTIQQQYRDGGRTRTFSRQTKDGVWNKVSYHVPWILETAAKMGEKLDTCDPPKVTKPRAPRRKIANDYSENAMPTERIEDIMPTVAGEITLPTEGINPNVVKENVLPTESIPVAQENAMTTDKIEDEHRNVVERAEVKKLMDDFHELFRECQKTEISASDLFNCYQKLFLNPPQELIKYFTEEYRAITTPYLETLLNKKTEDPAEKLGTLLKKRIGDPPDTEKSPDWNPMPLV